MLGQAAVAGGEHPLLDSQQRLTRAARGDVDGAQPRLEVVAVPLVFILLGTGAALAALAIYVIVVWRHSDNIKRLQAGTEPRIGERR